MNIFNFSRLGWERTFSFLGLIINLLKLESRFGEKGRQFSHVFSETFLTVNSCFNQVEITHSLNTMFQKLVISQINYEFSRSLKDFEVWG
jgi:hypothetical protein